MNPVRGSFFKKLFVSDKGLSVTGEVSNRVKKNYLYGLIITIGINIAFYYGFTLSLKIEADSILKDIESKRMETVAIKPAYTFQRLKADINKFNEMLPHGHEMTKIIRELDSLARGVSLSIRDVSYDSKKAAQSGIYPISISFPVEGKYANVKSFIYKLESSRRLLTIDDLSLEKASGREDIRLKIRVSVYLKNAGNG